LNQLIRLVYASRSVATPSTTHQGLDPGIARILAKSRKNNARLDVVGGLLFGDGYFLQCLEGDARIVQNLYSKIETDSRHRDVTVLLQSTIHKRTFDAWSMKYVPGEQRLQALLRRWDMSPFDPYQLSKVQIDEAVRFMRDADDAVDTVPSELQALPAEPTQAPSPPHHASQRDAASHQPSKSPLKPAPGSSAFVKVVVGVALVCVAAFAWLWLK